MPSSLLVGMALLWPSVTNDNPLLREDKTVHLAKPVVKGEKYVANVWIHNWNFDLPWRAGCLKLGYEGE